jgi:hypothetical protein
MEHFNNYEIQFNTPNEFEFDSQAKNINTELSHDTANSYTLASYTPQNFYCMQSQSDPNYMQTYNSYQPQYNNKGYNFVLPNYNYGYSSQGNKDEKELMKKVYLNINCSGKCQTFEFNKNNTIFPNDVCNVYFQTLRKFYHTVWLKRYQSGHSYYIPLNNEKQITLDYDLDLVLSVKNLVTVDFFKCYSDSFFRDIKSILFDINFSYINRSSRNNRPTGYYNTPKRIFVKNYFFHEHNEESLMNCKSLETYHTYEQPTVSFLVYKTKEDRKSLMKWTENIPNNSTIFKLLDINFDYRKINQQVLSIIDFLF